MARPLRIEFAGTLYHATSRGDGPDDIYLEDRDRKLWLEVLGQICERFNWVVHAYCQMLAMCTLHMTLIQQTGSTRVLFIRPTVVAADSKALAIAKELEQDISKPMDEAVNELRCCSDAC